MNITSIQSEKVLEAAKAKAEKIGIPMNIAIVDEGANLKLFLRMDEALLGCADIAIKKAKTARFFNKDSGKLENYHNPEGHYTTLNIQTVV